MNPTGDLMGAIDAMVANRHLTTTADIAERAERAARLMARNGFCAVRTHVDVTLENGLRSVEALTAVRERVRDVIDIEIVALTGWPLTGPDGGAQQTLLREAIAGGSRSRRWLPPPRRHRNGGTTAVLLEIAADLGVGVDLHTDETLDPASTG